MHKSSKTFFALTSGLLLTAMSTGAIARSVVCESQERQTQHCYADTRNGVTLAVQYSHASCRQGSTWGYDERGIWVANGCRAQFDLGDYRSSYDSDGDSKAAAALAIGLIGAAAIAAQHGHGDDHHDYRPYDDDYNRYRQDQHVTCESRDNRHEYCRVNLRHARVDLDRQLSGTQCRYGDNWGWDDGGIWVDRGCRATFSVY